MSKLLEQINSTKTNKRLGDLVFINQSSIVNGFPYNEIEYIDTASVTLNNFDSPQILNINEAPSRAKRLLKDGDTILSTVRPNLCHYGFIKNPKPNTVASTGFVVLTPKNINPFYLYSYLTQNSITDTLSSIAEATTTTFPAFRPEVLSEMEIEIPDLPIQNKIAEILSAYDSKIENNNKIIKNLEATAQAIFNEWFINFRFPGYEKAKFIESEMGEIPEGWEVKSLDDVCDISIGRTPPRQEYEWFSRNPKDVKWISIKDLGIGGIFISKTDEYLTKKAVEKFNIPVIPKGTLVVSFKLTMGKVAITTEDMLSNEAIAHLKIKKDTSMFVEYLYLIMKSYNYDSLGSTSSIATAVNSKTIKNIEIIIPEKEILGKFRKVIKPFFEMMNVIQNESINLKQSRDQLLAKLI